MSNHITQEGIDSMCAELRRALEKATVPQGCRMSVVLPSVIGGRGIIAPGQNVRNMRGTTIIVWIDGGAGDVEELKAHEKFHDDMVAKGLR